MMVSLMKDQPPMDIALIALGANLPSQAGTPAQTLAAALAQLDHGPVRVAAVSRFYETPCFPVGAGPDYVNAAAVVHGALSADALLARLHEIEAEFGRARLTRWGMRTLDLDLLAFGAQVLPDRAGQAAWMELPAEAQRLRAPDQLVVPHPRLQDRAFVLVPLADVAADWVHPVTQQSVANMLAALDPAEVAQVRAIPGPPTA